MAPPSPANFYFPASGVLKITLRPCLRPSRPRRGIAVVVVLVREDGGEGASLRMKG